jgi:ribonuclease HI
LAKITQQQLASLIREYVDTDRLLAEHPEVTRGDLQAFWKHLGIPASVPMSLFQEPPAAQAAPARAQQSGVNLLLIARCDGAARGNPGPASIGVVLEDQEGQDLLDVGEVIGETTCNVAEYTAVIRAAEKALELGGTELVLKLDSQLLARQLKGSYRVKAPHLQPLHQQALRLLRQFRRWDVVEVPRTENTAADRLANRALDGKPIQE